MFLPSLLGRPVRVSGEGGGHDDDGDDDDGAEDLAFTCTPGETGLTQRLPLTLRYECEPGKVLPLDLLPLPYVLPGEKRSGGVLDSRGWVFGWFEGIDAPPHFHEWQATNSSRCIEQNKRGTIKTRLKVLNIWVASSSSISPCAPDNNFSWLKKLHCALPHVESIAPWCPSSGFACSPTAIHRLDAEGKKQFLFYPCFTRVSSIYAHILLALIGSVASARRVFRFCSVLFCSSLFGVTAPRFDFDKTRDDSERPWVWDQAFSSLDHTMRSWPGVGR